MDDYQLEEVARSYLGMGIQSWGQTAEQREKATREYIKAAGLMFGSSEATEWLSGVLRGLRRGRFEDEVEQLVAALKSRRSAAAA